MRAGTQCVGMQHATLLKPLPAPSDAETPTWFWLCHLAKERIGCYPGVCRGVRCDGLLREGTCVCSDQVCCVLWCGQLPLWATLSCSSPALEVPMHITDTNKQADVSVLLLY